MPLIRLEQQHDDAALLFRLQHVVSGAVRYVRPKVAHVVKLDNWFGPRWRCFAGSPNGVDLHPEDRLAVPPFAPKRVVSEVTYRRRGDRLEKIEPRRLHSTPIVPSAAMPHYLDERTPSGIFVWYSGNTRHQDRAALMVYEIEKGADQRAWYAEFQRRDGTWVISAAVGISVTEIADLETAYENRLAPLARDDEDAKKDSDRQLWLRALDAADGPDAALASVLIEKYRRRNPENLPIRLLAARNLAGRRIFAAAEKEFRAIERGDPSERWRRIWLMEWATFCSMRGDVIAVEAAYRELADLMPGETPGWVLLGSFLARQGRLDEAETIHRHATQLPGDPDEAYLNLGYVLRATGRFEEAAAALENALKLCPDYPEASAALADVRAAIELRDNGE